MKENTKMVLVALLIAIMLVTAVSIGASFDTIRENTNYKLEVWSVILCLIAFIIVYANKTLNINVSPKVHVNVPPPIITETGSKVVEDGTKGKTNELNDLKVDKVQPWKDINVGEISLDGEVVK